MHLIIADHTLKDYQGHSFEYCNSIRNIALKKGWEVTTLGTCEINQEVKSQLNAIPFFKYDFFHQFALPSFTNLLPSKFSNFLNSRWNAYQHNQTLFNTLCKLLGSLKTTDPTLILFPTFSFNDIIGITRFAEKLPRASNTQIAMVQHFTSRPNLEKDHFPHRLYKHALDYLSQSLAKNRIHLFTDSQDLNDEYKFYTNKPFKILPIPHTFHTDLKPQIESKQEKLVVGYLGDARTNKGFHLIPEAIKLVNISLGDHSLHWKIQANIRNHQEWQTVQAVNLLKTNPCIQLHHTAMDTNAYHKMMAEIDIFMLPYTLENYHSQTSGVFSEIRGLGKVSVVTRGTWMAREITRSGGGILCMPEDSKSLADAIIESIERYAQLKAEAESAGKKWIEFHNCENYMTEMLSDISFNTAGKQDS